jgi:two-component system chemotaxis response regulator CheY
MARILIIDDSEHIRHLLALTLKMKKHEVTEATNGQEGFESLQGGAFDLIICDVDMPVMTGLQFLEKIRDEIGESAPPCMIITAEERDTRERAAVLGASAVLAKPFEPLALVTEIERLIAG